MLQSVRGCFNSVKPPSKPLFSPLPTRMENPRQTCGSSVGHVLFSACCPGQRTQELFKLNYKIIVDCPHFKNWLKQKENVNKTKCWQRRRTKGTLIHCRWGCSIEQPLWKSLAVTDEVKHLRSHNSIMPVTRLYSREMKIYAVYKSLYTNIFSGSLHNCSDLETTQVSFNG